MQPRAWVVMLALIAVIAGACASAPTTEDAATSPAEAVDQPADSDTTTSSLPGSDRLLLSVEPTAPVARPDVEAVEPSVVRVIGLGCGAPAIGTGFAIESNLIVTNAHLVAGRDAETLAVQNLDGDEFSAVLIGFDPDLDLALLHVEDTDFAPLTLITDVPLVDGVAIGIRTDDEVNVINEIEFTVDAPVNVNWDGVFQDSESRFRGLRMLADIRRGDSGSPLLINDTDVIGLVQSTTRNQPRGYAVGAADISEFAAAIGPVEEAAHVTTDRCA